VGGCGPESGRIGRGYLVATVVLDDRRCDALAMGRGPPWVTVNPLRLGGLRRAGYAAEAGELGGRPGAMLLGDKDIFEYYQPETGEGPPKAASTFGWSSALFIELAIEESRVEAGK